MKEKTSAQHIDATSANAHLRSMFRAAALGIPVVFLTVTAAFAETPPSSVAPEGERFTITPTEGGYLRLDKETGALSFCTVRDGVAACRLGAEERAGLEAEIERLRKENERLAARADAAPPPPSARKAPSEEEFERALSFTERFLRRIMRVFREEAPSGGRL